jgi:transketolase
MNAETKPGAVTPHDLTSAIRFLAIDAVQAVNPGHPGAPLGMAEIALALWHGQVRQIVAGRARAGA